ncbi:MAG: hypothetical protein Q4A79_02090 [Candidatus Saccharibacteria bacterium]|nr:hypothetical protein [Candidatus Saccharibacteria bacterium]
MISPKYKEIYNAFIEHYKDKHVNPWHEISESELKGLYNDLICSQNIVDDYSFSYLMNFIIKRLSGVLDAHTQYNDFERIPMDFRMFDDKIIVNYPTNLKGATLVSVNEISTDMIIGELDDIITYGTNGKRKYETEKSFSNKKKLFGLPSLRDTDVLTMKFMATGGALITKEFKKEERYSESEMLSLSEYLYEEPSKYRKIADKLIITHSSIQNRFKENIEKKINDLNGSDLSRINNIIVDIRGNTGGNSANNKPLMAFLEKCNKRLICLTDYRVFSGGRYALLDLIKLGATTIGSEISTPLNCYGNSNWLEYKGYWFSSSESFLAPNFGWGASSKEEYSSRATKDFIIPVFFKPDIFMEQSKEDFMAGVDTVLEYTIKN